MRYDDWKSVERDFYLHGWDTTSLDLTEIKSMMKKNINEMYQNIQLHENSFQSILTSEYQWKSRLIESRTIDHKFDTCILAMEYTSVCNQDFYFLLEFHYVIKRIGIERKNLKILIKFYVFFSNLYLLFFPHSQEQSCQHQTAIYHVS